MQNKKIQAQGYFFHENKICQSISAATNIFPEDANVHFKTSTIITLVLPNGMHCGSLTKYI